MSIAAVDLECLGGDFQGKLLPQIEEEIVRCKTMGIKDINSVLTM